MSLSDRERRLLAEMEAALASDDPRLQTTLTQSAPSIGRSPSLLQGAALLVIGIAALFAGLIAKVTIIGIGGFILALGGVLIAIRGVGAPRATKSPKAPRARTSFNDRLQNRWDQRNEQ